MPCGAVNTIRSLACLGLLLGALTATADDTSQITEGYVNAPIQEVWGLFTTSDGYKILGGDPAEVDLRLGGLIRTRPPQSATDTETLVNEVLAYDPQRMLAIRVIQAPASAAWRDAIAGTWTVIYFTPSGADMTHVRIVGLGYRDDPQSQAMRAFFADANRRTLDQAAKRYWPKCKLCAAPETQSAEQ